MDYDFTGGQIINFYSLTLQLPYNSAVLVHFFNVILSLSVTLVTVAVETTCVAVTVVVTNANGVFRLQLACKHQKEVTDHHRLMKTIVVRSVVLTSSANKMDVTTHYFASMSTVPPL